MEQLVPRIEQSLTAQKKSIPKTLELLKLETETSKHNTIALAMHCFWTGEVKLGAIDGVVTTEAGWYDKKEVTLVTYHQDLINLETLLNQAAKIDCAHKVFLKTETEIKSATSLTKLNVAKLDLKDYRPAKASDQKTQLTRTKYAGLKFSPAQATKINAFVRTSPDKVDQYLTRKQAKLVEGK